MDYVRIILNDGRYQFRIVGTVPNWAGWEGEAVVYSAGNERAMYVYINGIWCNISWSIAGAAQSVKLIDADYDTKVDVEESADEDIIRFDTGDTQGGTAGERMTIDYNGVALTTDLKLTFDGRGGDTYWKYNTATEYLEGWVDGTKRVDL